MAVTAEAEMAVMAEDMAVMAEAEMAVTVEDMVAAMVEMREDTAEATEDMVMEDTAEEDMVATDGKPPLSSSLEERMNC